MKIITLNARKHIGMQAIVDDEVYDKLINYSWHLCHGYACRKVGKKAIYMHKEIMAMYGMDNTKEGDHINLNKLDNRIENLRPANRQENQWNRGLSKNNTTGYKGVSYSKRYNRYEAYIYLNNKKIYLGNYITKEEAALAYNRRAINLFGEFARLNEVKIETL